MVYGDEYRIYQVLVNFLQMQQILLMAQIFIINQ